MVQNSKEDYQLAQKVTQLLSFFQEALRSEAAAYVQPKTSNDEAQSPKDPTKKGRAPCEIQRNAIKS